jgi:hypothetical protein
VRVQLEYRPNSAAPESVQVWADGQLVPLPAAVRPVPTQQAAKAMISALAADGFAPLIEGRLARWGHPGAVGAWWEPSTPGNGNPTATSKAEALA